MNLDNELQDVLTWNVIRLVLYIPELYKILHKGNKEQRTIKSVKSCLPLYATNFKICFRFFALKMTHMLTTICYKALEYAHLLHSGSKIRCNLMTNMWHEPHSIFSFHWGSKGGCTQLSFCEKVCGPKGLTEELVNGPLPNLGP